MQQSKDSTMGEVINYFTLELLTRLVSFKNNYFFQFFDGFYFSIQQPNELSTKIITIQITINNFAL